MFPRMKAGPRGSDIDSVAAQWAARVDRGLTPSENAELEAWLARSVRHKGALVRAQAMLAPASVRPVGYDASRATPKLGRRALLAGSVAAGAALLVSPWLIKKTDGYDTVLGEVRSVPLADGSVITLNTGSRVEVALTGDRRELKLLEGETFFEVASDKQRPFTVEAAGIKVRAVGTAFVVRNLDRGGVEVVVHEGEIEMTGATPSALSLCANERARAEAGKVEISKVDGDELNRGLAWRDGKIAFTGETLGHAVEEFNRYNATKLSVADARIAKMTVAGWFSNRDPEAFAEAVSQALDLGVDRSNSGLTIVPARKPD